MKQPRLKTGRFGPQIDMDELVFVIHETKPKRTADLEGTGRPGWSRANLYRAVKALRRGGFLKRRPSMKLTEAGTARAETYFWDRKPDDLP